MYNELSKRGKRMKAVLDKEIKEIEGVSKFDLYLPTTSPNPSFTRRENCLVINSPSVYRGSTPKGGGS